MTRDDRFKAHENRIRRHAASAGYDLQRNPIRTPSAPAYGLYRLDKGKRFTLTLEAAERAIAAPREGAHSHAWSHPDTRTTRWLTPPHIVEALGLFDLDPCGAPGHELASKTYLLERGEDGLTLPWKGRVFLNPPYGAEGIPFMRRMVEHERGTALIFARTDTKYFHETVWQAASAVLFVRGRLAFLNADGSKSTGSGAPSCLVAYGVEDAEALANSGLPGRTVTL